MTCKKCSYILYGSENFCPHCGEKCQSEEIRSQQTAEDEPKPIFISRDTSTEEVISKNRIFETEMPSERFSDIPDTTKHSKKQGSSRALVAFLSVLCVLLSVVALISAADYFDFVPAVSDFLNMTEETTESTTLSKESEFAHSFGTVFPQINYAPVNCVVSSSNSISLRKGPSESYGQIALLPSGTEVQVIGGSAESETWVYVYVHSEDFYGWLNASYISGELPEKEEKQEEDK